MTREEALIKVKGYLTDCIPLEDNGEIDEILKALEQQTSDDCVSRKEVLNTLFYKSDGNCEVVLNKELRNRINSLSSVTPTRKVGEWINEGSGNRNYHSTCYCSNCKDYYTRDWKEMKYCPNCGADMRGNEDGRN